MLPASLASFWVPPAPTASLWEPVALCTHNIVLDTRAATCSLSIPLGCCTHSISLSTIFTNSIPLGTRETACAYKKQKVHQKMLFPLTSGRSISCSFGVGQQFDLSCDKSLRSQHRMLQIPGRRWGFSTHVASVGCVEARLSPPGWVFPSISHCVQCDFWGGGGEVRWGGP